MSSSKYFQPIYILPGEVEPYERTDKNPLVSDEFNRTIADKSFLPNQLPQVDEASIIILPESRLHDRIFTEPERRRWRNLFNPEDLNIQEPKPEQPTRATERMLSLNVYPDGTPKTHQGFSSRPQFIQLQEEKDILTKQIAQIEQQLGSAPDVDKPLLTSVLERLRRDSDKISEIINPNFRLELGIERLASLLGVEKKGAEVIERPPYVQLGQKKNIKVDFDSLSKQLLSRKVDKEGILNLVSRFSNINEERANELFEGKEGQVDINLNLGNMGKLFIEAGIAKADIPDMLSKMGVVLDPEDEIRLESFFEKEAKLILNSNSLPSYMANGIEYLNKRDFPNNSAKSDAISDFLDESNFAVKMSNINSFEARDMSDELGKLRIAPSNKNYNRYARDLLILENIAHSSRRPDRKTLEEFGKVGNKKSRLDKMIAQIRKGELVEADK